MIKVRWGSERDRQSAVDLAVAASYSREAERLIETARSIGEELDRSSRVLLVEQDDVSVGMGRWVQAGVGPEDRTPVSGLAHINMINVHPDYRRRGIARLIVCELIRDSAAHGMTRWRLYVSTDNPSAIALYRSEGFELSEERIYSAIGEDVVTMFRIA